MGRGVLSIAEICIGEWSADPRRPMALLAGRVVITESSGAELAVADIADPLELARPSVRHRRGGGGGVFAIPDPSKQCGADCIRSGISRTFFAICPTAHKRAKHMANETQSTARERQLQLELDKLLAEARRLERVLADSTNRSPSTGEQPSQTTRRRERSPTPASDAPPDKRVRVDDQLLDADHAAVKDAGRSIVLQHCLWLREDLFNDVTLDDNYVPLRRFDNDNNKKQAELRIVINALPKRFKNQIGRKAVQRAFLEGMIDERAALRKRVVVEAPHEIFLESGKYIVTSEAHERARQYKKVIGWKETDADGKPANYYSVFEVPVLHKTWDDKKPAFNPNTAFRKSTLKRVYVACVRGRHGLIAWNDHRRNFVPASTIRQSLHNITCTTPAALAFCAVMLCWALSGDTMFQTIGNVTGINWKDRYDKYLKWLQTGIDKNKRSVRELFKEWDEAIFPNQASQYGSKHGAAASGPLEDEMESVMAQLEADEEAESSGTEEDAQA